MPNLIPYRVHTVADAIRERFTLPRYRVSFRVLLGPNTGADQTYTVRAWDASDAHWRATVRGLRSPVVLSAGPTRIVGGGADTDYTRPCPCRASGPSAWCGLCDGAGSVPVCRPDNACPACHGCGITTEPGGTRVIPCACIVRAVAAHPNGPGRYCTEERQTGERQADAEQAAGHTTAHTDADALFAELDTAREHAAADDDEDDEDDAEIGVRLCRCAGEGCDLCDNTGVIYP